MVEVSRLEVTPEEFLEWKQHPVSRLMMKLLRIWEDSLKEQWAAGAFSGEDLESTSLANAAALGEVNILRRIQELDADQLSEVIGDE